MFEQGRLDRVLSLHNPMLKGEITTYYTPGYEKRAREVQRFLTEELKSSRKQLHFDLALTLAVLDSKQYPQVEHQTPYPAPSVTGDPPVALMPVNWTDGVDVLPKETDAGVEVKRQVAAHGMSWRDASQCAYDLWGGHELGHAVIDAYGIEAGTRWLNEMLASFVLYAYLQAEGRDRLWLLDVLEAGCQIDRPQEHVSLDDFESQYLKLASEDPHKYLWYQGQFFEQIKKIYARHGVNFLQQIRQAFPEGKYKFATLGNAETLRRLDAIDSVFSAWAASLAKFPRKPSSSNN